MQREKKIITEDNFSDLFIKSDTGDDIGNRLFNGAYTLKSDSLGDDLQYKMLNKLAFHDVEVHSGLNIKNLNVSIINNSINVEHPNNTLIIDPINVAENKSLSYTFEGVDSGRCMVYMVFSSDRDTNLKNPDFDGNGDVVVGCLVEPGKTEWINCSNINDFNINNAKNNFLGVHLQAVRSNFDFDFTIKEQGSIHEMWLRGFIII